MAFNVQVTRINSNAKTMNAVQVVRTSNSRHTDRDSAVQQPAAAMLVNVPEDRNIRKFPVRIFEVQAED